MVQTYIDAIEASVPTSMGTWFQGYNNYGTELAWFGYRMYQNYCTVICFAGYNTNTILKGVRNNAGEWTFYRLYGQ